MSTEAVIDFMFGGQIQSIHMIKLYSFGVSTFGGQLCAADSVESPTSVEIKAGVSQFPTSFLTTFSVGTWHLGI